MSEPNNFLLLIWKDSSTHRNFTVGKLTRGEKFTFEYCDEYKQAKDCGWEELKAFPEHKIYESEVIFPVFASRLPDKKRRGMDKILEKYGLKEFDEFELLRKSEGRLPIDTYSFIDPIFKDDESVQRDFFVMGIRFNATCKGDNCLLLPTVGIGDTLLLKEEPNNPNDSNAIKVMTSDGKHLGYIPRYYNVAILERLHKNMSYSCTIIDFNPNQNCSECIKVRLNMPAK